MIGAGRINPSHVRVWIVEYEDWMPLTWRDIPPRARVLVPFDASAFSAEEGTLLVEGFNQQMLASGLRRWAIVHPITVRFDGDLVAGQLLQGPPMRPSSISR
jgi:hypothetical protein